MGKNIFFPDFCKSRTIPEVLIRLFDSPNSQYDVIIGRDLLTHGLVLDHARNIITWDGLSITMTKTSDNTPSINTSFSCSFTAAHVYATASTKILEAKYDRFSPEDIVKNCSHLNRNNQDELLQLLSKFPHLFSGTLGRSVHRKFSIELKDPHVTPIFCNPYPIPLNHQKVFLQELNHLIDKKVLQRIPRSEWAFPTFLIPKKDGRVRWISYFRRLNKLLKRPRYFLPNIPTIMQKRAGFTFITKLDISMGFYTFELDQKAQEYCVISTPFGLYKYLSLPMGLTNSPDMFQSVMHPLF